MLLTITVFAPILGMLLCWLAPERLAKVINVATCFVVFVLTLLIASQMGNWGEYNLVVQESWIGAINTQYYLGVDGVGASLLLLTSFVSLVSAIASWGIQDRARGYHMMFLLLLTGMLGVFVALDLFLFYVFWEIMLLPMYFLIGIWGGPRRQYAAIKFFLYTLAGSVLLLAAIILVVLYNKNPDGSLLWEIPALAAKAGTAGLVPGALGVACFVGAFIGFAIKIPSFPFHTWLPDAHVEAPTPISMILAGVLLKMGGYGLIRIAYPFFPEPAALLGPIVATISVIAIVYGAFVAMGQTDFKRMIAYSSVSHMGFVTLGLASGTAAGINGAMYMMLAHGTISAMLFMIVGVIYDRAHHRDMDRFGGLAWVMPRYFVMASFAFFASLGLPGMSGFIAEITTFLGVFNATAYRPWAIAALLGVVLTAGYYLIALQKIYLKATPDAYKDKSKYPDASRREMLVLVPLAIVTLWMGVQPGLFMDMYTGVIDGLADTLTQAASALESGGADAAAAATGSAG